MTECKNCKWAKPMDNGIYKFGTSSVVTLNGNNNIRCTKDSVINLTFDEHGMVCRDYEEVKDE